MHKDYSLGELQELLSSAQNFFVFLPLAASFDQVASGLACFLALVKAGKKATILSSEEMRVEFSHLVGVDRIVVKVTNDELVLTIQSPIENVEKVSTNDTGGKLNIVIRPKAGCPPVEQEEVVFSSSGGSADLLLVIEPRKLESLGRIYEENKDLFSQKPIVNVSHFAKAENLGRVNIIDGQAACCAEVVIGLLAGLNLSADEDLANNLLLGLRQGTQSFQNLAVTADTFEAAAWCLRNGAGKSPLASPLPEEPVPPAVPPAGGAPSPDWFEPKIYKGSTLP